MKIITIPLISLMSLCYDVVHDYILAIIAFTILTKVILFPLSLWVQKNSIAMVRMTPQINRIKMKYYGDKDAIAEETQSLYKKEGYHPLLSTVPMLVQIVLLMGVIDAIKQILGQSDNVLMYIPSQEGGWIWIMPVLAGLAALALGLAQNYLNPLQKEQPKAEQWSTNLISVAISLVLGGFVTVGVCIYWISSNLLTIVQQVVLNLCMDPKKYIDYEELEKSKKSIEKLNSLSSNISKEDRIREKNDYKKFFSVANKHIVFYSESSGFYKYFKGLIEYLIENTNLTIHYITSDPKDAIFQLAKEKTAIRPYYIGEKKLITLMMKMDADMVVMTMPDLENYHIKRSYVRKDIEYVNVPHGIDSIHLTYRKGALDHFDTIFCVGPHHVEEVRKTEEVYGLPEKKLVEWGYSLLDDMRAAYKQSAHEQHDKPHILIAPSWQIDNIVDSCLEKLLDELGGGEYKVIVRPHPQAVRMKPDKINSIKNAYANNENIVIQTDFSSNSTVFEADLVITDWSGIGFEYAFTTGKPVLYINTPMKVMNPEYEKINVPPMTITLRNELGRSLNMDELDKTKSTVEEMFKAKDEYKTRIEEIAQHYVYNLDNCVQIGADALIDSLCSRQKQKQREDGHQ